jgi:hypothetical protein
LVHESTTKQFQAAVDAFLTLRKRIDPRASVLSASPATAPYASIAFMWSGQPDGRRLLGYPRINTSRRILVMNGSVLFKSILAATAAVGALVAGVLRAEANYVQTNLVSDLSGIATVTDTELKNPWGLSFTSGVTPFWVSNQFTNTTTLYGVTGATNVSEFPVNPPTNVVAVPGGPTGQVSNTNSASFGGAPFIFAGLNGSISSWAGGLSATAVTSPGAAITGLAINHAQTEVFAASAGGVNVFNSSFGLVGPSFTTRGHRRRRTGSLQREGY